MMRTLHIITETELDTSLDSQFTTESASCMWIDRTHLEANPSPLPHSGIPLAVIAPTLHYSSICVAGNAFHD